MGAYFSQDEESERAASAAARRAEARAQTAALPQLIAETVGEFLSAEQQTPAYKPLTEAEAASLSLSLPANGAAASQVVDELKAILRASPSSASSAFFNQLFGGREPLAALADAVVAVLNCSMYTYKAGGIHVLIEHEVLTRMASMVYKCSQKKAAKSISCTFTPGGSLSNMAALILARNAAYPDARDYGWMSPSASAASSSSSSPTTTTTTTTTTTNTTIPPQPVIYTNVECHYSIRKAAGMVGLGRKSVRYIRCDSKGAMRVDELARAMAADVARGARPLAVVATAGTTVRGAYDPLDAIADVCERFNCWMHVDGAYGCSVVFDDALASTLLKGLERAHSITWDAHKMMGVPLTCAALFVGERGGGRRALTTSLAERASYLFQGSEDDADYLAPGDYSLQCGRRNDALKLWAAWRHLGDEGWRRRLQLQFAARDYVIGVCGRSPRLDIVTEPMALNVCFRVDDGRVDAAALCRRLHVSARALVGYGQVEGETIVRMAIINPYLEKKDLDDFFDQLFKTADELLAEATPTTTTTTTTSSSSSSSSSSPPPSTNDNV